MKFYGVWSGTKTGIFTSWDECSAQIKGVKGAKYKKLNATDLVSAQKEFEEGYQPNTKSGDSPKKKSKPKKVHVVQDLHKKEGYNYFCDGACQKNPSPCGSGVAIFKDGEIDKMYYGDYTTEGTNNIGELKAVLFCLKDINDKNRTANIYVDSQYTISAFSEWAFNWSKNNWMTGSNEPVKNKELVEACFEEYKKVKSKVNIVKVKSHIGELGNELADRMAINSSNTKTEDWTEYTDRNIEEILKIHHLRK